MDLLTFLSRHVFTPFYKRRHGINPAPFIPVLQQSQYCSPEQIEKIQWQKLKQILDFSYQHNSFYRKRFESIGAVPEDIRSFSDLEKFPVLTKDDIRHNPVALISDGFEKDKMRKKRTGGSTGVPLHLYRDSDVIHFKAALSYRHDGWAGFYPGSLKASLWGDTAKDYSWKQKLYMYLCERTIYLDTLNMDEKHMLGFVDKLRRKKPRLLFGHAHSLYFFADFLRKSGIDDIRFDSIISSAEILLPDERAVIEDVFGTRVFDRYGCEELGLIATECEQHDGLHIAAEGLYVEIEDGDENKPGDLIITDLIIRGMPLIRYRVGDQATSKSGLCECGRGLPRLGRIVGRTTDVLYTPDGRKISGVSLLDTFTIHIPGFKQVQLVQNRLDEIIFKIVKSSEFSEESLCELEQKVPRYFGPEMKHKVEFVDRIELTPRGKFQFSICNLSPEEIPAKNLREHQ